MQREPLSVEIKFYLRALTGSNQLILLWWVSFQLRDLAGVEYLSGLPLNTSRFTTPQTWPQLEHMRPVLWSMKGAPRYIG
jgi:hypothetical protein